MQQFRKSVAHDDGNGGVIIETRQDITDILEKNKREYNSFDERARWSDDIMGNKIASVPFTVIDDLNKIGIMRGFHVIDEKRMAEWLNKPEAQKFRTRPGKV